MPISSSRQDVTQEKLDKNDTSPMVTKVFTGLIEGTGKVTGWEASETGRRLKLDVGLLANGTRLGDSIAINGCCLTVVSLLGNELGFDLLKETEEKTSLGVLQADAPVNLERALPAGGRYGGHFLTGHIDDTGVVKSWEQKGQDFELRIGMAVAQGAYLVPKGCIAIDGISLTVAQVDRKEFSVWIIPHTRAVTSLRERRVGDRVNLEFDLLAKYTEKILAPRLSSGR